MEAEAGRGFKNGTGVATGVFLGLGVLPHSLGSSPFSVFLLLLPPFVFSLLPLRSFESLLSLFLLGLPSL